MEIKFRNAVEQDLPKLVELLANDDLGKLRENPNLPLDKSYLEAFGAINSDPNNQLLVATLNNEIIGMLQITYIPYLTHKGSWRCLIEGVRVSENARGMGIGELMFNHSIELATEKGCSLIQLTSDKQRPDAIRFYEKLGFVATHEGFKLKVG
ncbi:GNAT family N-acetyltransferase [Parashewanella tropica]|uniref:GNAT family N-acetyltransferase n=1 Tax=Parashewanella tropica TaxID=2547970 RepID=UPI0010596CF9|nr:GNAT family N-acetyltransferase [Parashewanella tropica]